MLMRRFAAVIAGLLVMTSVYPTAPVQAVPPGPQGAPEVVGTEQAVVEQLGGGRLSTTIRHRDATYVKVHFEALALRPGDYVTVAGAHGREMRRYDASMGRHGLWALSVEGDSAKVTLRSRTGGLGSRVSIDRIARGFTAEELAAREGPRPKSVCGANDYRDAVCYRTSHPAEYQRSRAVARLLIGGTSLCTGWRLGPNNRLLTNNHCVSTTSRIRQTEVQFNYDCPTCGGTGTAPITKVFGDQVLRTSATANLDYTLFTVQNFASITSFGSLELDARRPVRGEEIYIPGHPLAKVKKLSVTSDRNNGNCVIDQPASGVNSGYLCDTESGSSGSPVLARSSHKVVALHHLGGCPNWGTRIELVKPEIDGLL